MKPQDWPEGTVFLMCLTQQQIEPDSAVEQEAFDSSGNRQRVPVSSRLIGESVPTDTKTVLALFPGWTNWNVIAAECN